MEIISTVNVNVLHPNDVPTSIACSVKIATSHIDEKVHLSQNASTSSEPWIH